MGCWYKTCGISNLHIRPGAETYVFVLTRNQNTADRCYATAFWKPALLPFRAEYNDYGAGENCSGPGLPILMERIKKALNELDQGENEYHDIPVTRDAFDEHLFFEAVHERRLSIGTSGIEVDFVMFRKDIVDEILKNWVIEEYVGNGKGTTGWGNSYIEYKFADILKDIPSFLQELHEFLVKDEVGDEEDGDSHEVRKKLKEFRATMIGFSGFDCVFEYGRSNRVANWVRRDSYRYSRLGNIDKLISELAKEKKFNEAEELLTDLLVGNFIDSFMESTRKNWAPAGHEGSQANDHHGYRILIQAMTNALDAEKKEYEE